MMSFQRSDIMLQSGGRTLNAGAATKTHAPNLLHRLIDGKMTDGPGIVAPQVPTFAA